MDAHDWLALVTVFVLLLLSAFFAGSETALTASSRASMARLEKQGNQRAGIVNRLLEQRERLLGALLFGNNAVNIAASALATGVLLTWFGHAGVLYATVVMTIVVVVFSEVLPKTAAFNAPDRIALAVARPMFWFVKLFGPVLMAVEALVRWLLKQIGMTVGEDQEVLSAREELRGAVDLLHSEGDVETLDRDMFGGVLDLRDLVVSDVMIHRTGMITLNADDSSEDLVNAVIAAPVTRLPLWRDNPENIVGILHVKDLLRALHAVDGDAAKIDIAALMTPPWFVPDMRPVSEQLKAFRRRKTQIALVVDEYGEVEGLVTLEDILEEIVGDVADDFFQNILERDQAFDLAIFVYHQRDLRLAAAERLELLRNGAHIGHEPGRRHQRGNVDLGGIAVDRMQRAQQILHVQDADDVFRIAAPERQPRHRRGDHRVDQVFGRIVCVQGDHAGAVDHHVGHHQVAQIEHAAEHVTVERLHVAFTVQQIDGAAQFLARRQHLLIFTDRHADLLEQPAHQRRDRHQHRAE